MRHLTEEQRLLCAFCSSIGSKILPFFLDDDSEINGSLLVCVGMLIAVLTIATLLFLAKTDHGLHAWFALLAAYFAFFSFEEFLSINLKFYDQAFIVDPTTGVIVKFNPTAVVIGVFVLRFATVAWLSFVVAFGRAVFVALRPTHTIGPHAHAP